MSYSIWFICIALFPSYMVYHHVTRPPNVARSLDDIKALLAPSDVSMPKLLLSRALPNARLVRAFRLDNTFVNPSPVVHRDFIRKARDLMEIAAPRGDWNVFCIAVTEITEQYSPKERDSIAFATFVQSATFVVMMTTVFGVDATHLDAEDVGYVTKAINYIWLHSKTSTSSITFIDTLPQLDMHLRRWMPEFEGNPLNYIIPIYENMWRLVATALAHVIGCDHYIEAFLEYLHNPTTNQFQQIICDGVSVKSVISETLRLHPPAKRLGRVPAHNPLLNATSTFGEAFKPLGYIVRKCAAANTRSADIEALHRSAIWSKGDTEDPNVFDSGRFLAPLQGEQKESYIPFGYGRLQCVGATWAPRAAALIVAGILHKTQGGEDGMGIHITKGRKIGGREGWEGWSVTGTGTGEKSGE